MKRLAIYVFHDPRGQVRNYVLYFLRNLQKVVSEILVVVNGEIDKTGHRELEKIGVKILVRPNVGFDFGAWKAGLESYGFDKVKEFDELVLTNNTLYGPFYPLDDVFAEMSKRPCDFWGMNRHPAHDSFWVKGDADSRNENHIQSYWLVFRNTVLLSDVFEKYWKNLPVFHSYIDAVGYGETKLTGYFEKNGFCSDTYMDFNKYSRLLYGNPMFLSDKQIREDRYPFLKRKMFCMDDKSRDDAFNIGIFDNAKKALDFVRDNTSYDENMIWEDLLATQPLSRLNDCLGLTYIPGSYKEKLAVDGKAAVIVYVGTVVLTEVLEKYLKNLPDKMPIYIVSQEEEMVTELKHLLSSDIQNRVEFRIQPKGGVIAAWLTTCADVWQKFDYVGVFHAAELYHPKHYYEEEDWRCLQFECLAGTSEMVKEMLGLFEQNKKLGLLMPLNYDYSCNRVCGSEWGCHEKNATKFLKQHFAETDFIWDEHVLAPFGGMFWAKSAAMTALTDKNFSYADLANIKNSDEIIVRVLPILLQSRGYFAGFVASAEKAAACMAGMFYIQRRLKENLRLCCGRSNDWRLLNLFVFFREGVEALTHPIKDSCGFWKTKILYLLSCGQRRKLLNALKKEYKNKLKAKSFIKKLLGDKKLRR